MVARAAVLDIFRSYVGMRERSGNNDIVFADRYGITGSAWCLAMVQYGFEQAGVQLPHRSFYVPYAVQWARDNGQAIEVDQIAAGVQLLPVDLPFYTWDMANWGRWTPGTGDHVGIVEGWDGGDTIWTIEGNVGSPQGVWEKTRSISETVICFWRPTVFDDGGTLGVASTPEEDMTDDQAKKLDFIVAHMAHIVPTRQTAEGAFQAAVAARDNAGGARDHAVLVNQRLDKLEPKIDTQLAALSKLESFGTAGTSGTPVDVGAVIRDATPEQLAKVEPAKFLAALNLMFSQQPKPPVSPPADTEPDTPAVG